VARDSPKLHSAGAKHVNLIGDYVWANADKATENHDGFRLVRAVPDADLLAA
jgi:hypothetical protein